MSYTERATTRTQCRKLTKCPPDHCKSLQNGVGLSFALYRLAANGSIILRFIRMVQFLFNDAVVWPQEL